MSSFSDLAGGVRRSGSYVWDTNTLAWIRMTQPGAGGGNNISGFCLCCSYCCGCGDITWKQ